jgi:hypothetical protein
VRDDGCVPVELDHTVVRTPDGVRHARVRGVAVLLCGREIPEGSVDEHRGGDFDCPECLREAELRGDRSIGVVDA